MLTVIMDIAGSCLHVTILNIVLIVFLVLLEALMLTIVFSSKCIQKYELVLNRIKLNNRIDVVQFREKFAFPITSFATQHSFATHSVQLRYEGMLLMMVVFDYGHFS